MAALLNTAIILNTSFTNLLMAFHQIQAECKSPTQHFHSTEVRNWRLEHNLQPSATLSVQSNHLFRPLKHKPTTEGWEEGMCVRTLKNMYINHTAESQDSQQTNILRKNRLLCCFMRRWQSCQHQGLSLSLSCTLSMRFKTIEIHILMQRAQMRLRRHESGSVSHPAINLLRQFYFFLLRVFLHSAFRKCLQIL